MGNLDKDAPSHFETPVQQQTHLYDTDSETQFSPNDSLDTESTLVQPQHVRENCTATIAAKDIELQNLSRELERTKLKLEWSERRH